MEEIRREIDRLRHGWAAARGWDRLGRTYAAVLAVLALGALASRLFGPWPGYAWLEGRWVAVPLIALALLLFGGLLRRLAPRLARPSPHALVRDLDDTQGWKDAADATLSLERTGAEGTVSVFLRAQTAGRLRGLEAPRLWPSRHDGVWTRRLLLLLFVLALLLPGVDGLFGRRGAGRGEEAAVGVGTRGDPELPFDADRWLKEHARLYLTRPDREKAPLGLRVRLRTDRPLPVPYRTTIRLGFDDTMLVLGTLDVEAGVEAQHDVDVDLGTLEGLEGLLTPGRHTARARLTPREGPFTVDLESNELELEIQEGTGGGGGESPAPQPQPQPQEAERPPPPPVPDGEKEEPAAPPPDDGRQEVVEPLIRDDRTIEKDDAVVAVKDPGAGLEPPPPVPLSEALRDLDRVMERAMGSERMRPADRSFLERYFRLLRRAVGTEDGDDR